MKGVTPIGDPGLIDWREFKLFRQSPQFSGGVGLHLAHYLPAMDSHSDFGGAKSRGDLLREHTRNNKKHYLALSRSQTRVAFLQFRNLVLVLPCLAVTLQGLLNRIDEVLIPERFSQKFHCSRLHSSHSHRNVCMASDENDRDVHSLLK